MIQAPIVNFEMMTTSTTMKVAIAPRIELTHRDPPVLLAAA